MCVDVLCNVVNASALCVCAHRRPWRERACAATQIRPHSYIGRQTAAMELHMAKFIRAAVWSRSRNVFLWNVFNDDREYIPE